MTSVTAFGFSTSSAEGSLQVRRPVDPKIAKDGNGSRAEVRSCGSTTGPEAAVPRSPRKFPMNGRLRQRTKLAVAVDVQFWHHGGDYPSDRVPAVLTPSIVRVEPTATLDAFRIYRAAQRTPSYEAPLSLMPYRS